MALPLSVESAKALFAGLRCIPRGRADERMGLGCRMLDRFFFEAERNGLPSGEGLSGFVGESTVMIPPRCDGDSGDGERGELGEGELDLEVIRRKAGPLDGDLERDRRSWASAELGSDRGVFVEGRARRLPPLSR